MDLLAVTIVVMAAFSEQLGGAVGSPPFAFVWPPTVAATLAVSVQTSHFFPLQCLVETDPTQTWLIIQIFSQAMLDCLSLLMRTLWYHSSRWCRLRLLSLDWVDKVEIYLVFQVSHGVCHQHQMEGTFSLF